MIVDATEDKCCKCKAAQAKRSGVGNNGGYGFGTFCCDLSHKGIPTFH